MPHVWIYCRDKITQMCISSRGQSCANNMAYIPVSSPEYANGTGPFGWDTTSGRKLKRPIDDFVAWDSLLTLQEMESRRELIAVYAYFQQSGQSYTPGTSPLYLDRHAIQWDRLSGPMKQSNSLVM